MHRLKLLHEIANALDKEKSTNNWNFYAQDVLLVDNIKVEIDEVGELSFPLSERCVKILVNISSKDNFVSGDHTSSSSNALNNYEITKNKLHVSFNQQALNCMMNKFRIAFGFNDNCTLFPHLLSGMLIFGAGPLSNYKSEKIANSIGSLMISLPKSHMGGDFEITFGRKKHIFSSEGNFPVKAKCFSSYAESNYVMTPVVTGHCIVLFYCLLLSTKELVAPSLVNQKLSEALRKYFDLNEDEQKLIYLLNHIYTEHDLNWNTLKGEDHENSLFLYSAAKQLGLVPHLVLVEITECETPDEFPVVNNKKITLTLWVNSKNKKVPYSKYYASESDICFTKDTTDLEVYSTYASSDGNVIKCYRRAAVVLWPVVVKFSEDFSLGYNYFLGELIELCQTPGNQKKVIDIVTESLKCFCESYFVSIENKQKNILKLACIALYVENSETAFSLLSNSEWEALSNDFAEHLANLQIKYGVHWCVNLLNKMKTNSHNYELVNSFPLIKSFLENKVDTAVARLLLDVQYELITKEITRNKINSLEYLKNSLPERIDRLREFFRACFICKDDITLSKIIQNILSNIQQYPLTNLTELYIKLHESEERMHLKQLRSFLIKTIDEILNSEERSEYNWAINFQLSCNCETCAIATSFLQSKTEKTKVWPLREKLRNHIMEQFYCSSLPVKVKVRRTGSPYKLVLVKSGALEKNKMSQKLKLCQKKLRALKD